MHKTRDSLSAPHNTEEMPVVVTIGEALVEFISMEPGMTLHEAATFEKTVGNVPVRVAVGLARLETSSGFIGRVGDDPFGHFLADTLTAEGVDVSQLSFERNARTGLAFISRTAEGGQEFVFFRQSSADTLLSPGHIKPTYIKAARAIVYDSIGLAAEPCRSGVLKALAIARDSDVLRVYDINLQPSLWGSESEARYALKLGLDRADIVKLSLDEMEFLSGTRDIAKGMEQLWTTKSRQGNDVRLLIVTVGAQGCCYRTSTNSGQISGYAVDSLEAIGSGEGFLAGLLAELLWTDSESRDKLALEPLFQRDRIERALRFAYAASALTNRSGRSGVVPNLPSRSQVKALLNDTQ
jgi:fructokinase